MGSGIDVAAGAQVGSPNIGTLSGNAIWDQFVKNMILPTVIDGRNKEVPLLGLVKRNTQKVSGRFFGQIVRFGRNFAGVSAIHPEGNMPDPGQQGAYMYMSRVVDNYLRIKLTGALLRRAQDEGLVTAIDPLQFESQGAIEDMAIKQEIQLHGDGSGKRAEYASTSGGNGSIVVRLNQDNAGVANCLTRPTLYLSAGMRVSFATAAGTLRLGTGNQTGFYVVDVPTSNTVVLSYTLNGAAMDHSTIAGLTAGDWIVDAARETAASSPQYMDTAFKQEPVGLEAIFRQGGVLDGMAIATGGQQTGSVDYTLTSTTAAACGFQGVQVNSGALITGYPPPTFNQANVFGSGGPPRQISDSLLQQLVSDPLELNNSKVGILVSAFSLYNSYVDTLITDKRFNSTTLAGGHAGFSQSGGVTFNGMDWFKSRFALGNKCWGLDLSTFTWKENQALRVATAPGGPQYERVHDKDAFWMAMMESGNLFNELRQRAGGVLIDVY